MRFFWRFWVFGIVAAVCSSCVSKTTVVPRLDRYEFDETEMAVPFRIVLYAPNRGAAALAAAAAYQRVKQLNDMMSDYDPDSEVSRLSRTSGSGQAVPVSHDLWVVLQRAQWLAEKSAGAFDATVGPYVNLWREARREGKLPDPKRLARARLAVGYQHMKLDPKARTVTLEVPNMRLDLGGIAKGYAVDQALHVLGRFEIKSALVSGGGDLAVSDPPPGKKGWTVELPPLDASNAPSAKFLYLKRAGLSTSGDLFQRLDIGGRRYSHIVDPRTGIGLTDHSLVTVIAPDDFAADGLTKVMSVLNPQDALQFLSHNTTGVAVRIVRQPADTIQVYESKQFHRYYK